MFTFEQLLKGGQSDDEGQHPEVAQDDDAEGAALDGKNSTLRRRPGTRIISNRYRAALASAPERVSSPSVTALAPLQHNPINDTASTSESLPSASSMASSNSSVSTHARNHGDPLHIPSFLSLTLSILPDLRSRIFARIRAIFVSCFLPSSKAESLEAGTFSAADEKGLRTLQPERRLRRTGGKSMGPTVVIVAVAATMGFWVGYVVGRRGSGGDAGSPGMMVMDYLVRVRNML